MCPLRMRGPCNIDGRLNIRGVFFARIITRNSFLWLPGHQDGRPIEEMNRIEKSWT